MYVQLGPLLTRVTDVQQQKKKQTPFYTRALQNEEKSALIHNIEKLYVNKYQRGSSPEIEQLRQSELGK